MKGFLEWLKDVGGGQKIVWSVILLGIFTVFYAISKVSEDHFVEIAKWLTGFVFGGNIATKTIHAFAKNKENGDQ